MRFLLVSFFLLLACSSLSAADDEFPVRIRGVWVDSSQTCDSLKEYGLESVRWDARWLKITATNVFGTTQGRFFREISAPELSVEMQALNEPGSMITLSLSVDGRLHVIISGSEKANYQRC